MAENQVNVPVDSCYQVTCNKCGKITWGGCGRHVESAMRGVKDEDKCLCPREEAKGGWFGLGL